MQEVKIDMTISPVALVFGVPIMLAVIILGTMAVSRLGQPAIHVDAPNVSVNAPPPANVTANIDVPRGSTVVNVPEQRAPIVNIAAPFPEAARVAVNLPNGQEVKVVERVVEKPIDRPVYFYVDTREKANVTLDDVIVSAEAYLKRTGADYKKWAETWQSRAKEKGDEQILFNEVVIERRGGFKSDAKPSDIEEVCKLMVRMKEAKLSVPEIFKAYLSAANLVAFRTLLDGH